MEESYEGISRRKALKRIGAGTAIAWTAPVLMSVRSPAFAQASPTCSILDCLAFEVCGTSCPTCPGGAACARLRDGSCICWSGAGCIACNTDADCPAGSRCGDVNPNCGCGNTGNRACFVECGTSGSLPRGRRVEIRR